VTSRPPPSIPSSPLPRDVGVCEPGSTWWKVPTRLGGGSSGQFPPKSPAITSKRCRG
jgi:hypothetical protein